VCALVGVLIKLRGCSTFQ